MGKNFKLEVSEQELYRLAIILCIQFQAEPEEILQLLQQFKFHLEFLKNESRAKNINDGDAHVVCRKNNISLSWALRNGHGIARSQFLFNYTLSSRAGRKTPKGENAKWAYNDYKNYISFISLLRILLVIDKNPQEAREIQIQIMQVDVNLKIVTDLISLLENKTIPEGIFQNSAIIKITDKKKILDRIRRQADCCLSENEMKRLYDICAKIALNCMTVETELANVSLRVCAIAKRSSTSPTTEIDIKEVFPNITYVESNSKSEDSESERDDVENEDIITEQGLKNIKNPGTNIDISSKLTQPTKLQVLSCLESAQLL